MTTLREKRYYPAEEQKGCCKGKNGTKDQLLIDKAILKYCRKRHTSGDGLDLLSESILYGAASLDCRVSGDVWDTVADNVKKFLIDIMKTWKTELTPLGERLGVIHIGRGKGIVCHHCYLCCA